VGLLARVLKENTIPFFCNKSNFRAVYGETLNPTEIKSIASLAKLPKKLPQKSNGICS